MLTPAEAPLCLRLGAACAVSAAWETMLGLSAVMVQLLPPT